MRRLAQPAAPAAPTSTPAPSAGSTVTAVATTAPAAVPSLFSGALAAFGQIPDQLPAVVEEKKGNFFPYLQFYDHRSPQAAAIMRQHPSAQAGQPFVRLGDTFVAVASAAFQIVTMPFSYWLKTDGKGDWLGARLEKPPAGEPSYREQCVALTLVIPDANGVIDPKLAPAKLTLTTYRTVKTGFVYEIVKQANRTKSPEWVQESPFHGVLVQGGVPPLFRVAAAMKLEPGTAKGSGFAYVSAKAVCSTVSPQQAKAIDAYLGSAEGQADMKLGEAAFAAEIAEVKALAATTK